MSEDFPCAQFYSKGSYAYGSYPDIGELFHQQARERDVRKREVLLYRIQQLTVARVLFAPIMDMRALMAVGPRVADHAINSAPMAFFPSWEDYVAQESMTIRASFQGRHASPRPGRPATDCPP